MALPAGLGLAACDHAVPSQCRIRARVAARGARQPGVQELPAAQAVPSAPALTASRSALLPRPGAVAWNQLVPSQRKISIWSASDAVWQPDVQRYPTAPAPPAGPGRTPYRSAAPPRPGADPLGQ